jgi:hypothetical protein
MRSSFLKITLFTLLALQMFYSCKKGEVPGDKRSYVGYWRGINNSFTDTHFLKIEADGKAEYNEETSSGISNTTKSAIGYIYFDGYSFKVGNNRINKKFKTDMVPKRVTISAQPYTYYYIATFNGIEYKKD